ncbi:MAG: peptidoglycan D,D-transpeptidase FtsI family protein [Planctomycetota bacterium]
MRQRRVTVIFFALMLGLLAVQVRLLDLQLLNSDLWERESLRSTMSFRSLPFERGWILDRHGEPLATTEEVRDVHYRARGWRRGAVAGRVAGLLRLLDGARRSVPQAVAQAPSWLAELGSLRAAEIDAIRPGQRERDARTYLAWLFGEDLLEAWEIFGTSGLTPRLDELPGWSAALAAAQQTAAEEQAALADLARVTGQSLGELLEAMDTAQRRADARVTAACAHEEAPADPFARERELRAQFENDPVRILPQVSADARTLVAVRARELPGFEVATDLRRSYPETSADVAVTLLGRMGRPQTTDLAATEADRVRLAELASVADLSAEELYEYELLRIRVREISYDSEDERGLFGLEAALEPMLRGKRGWIASAGELRAAEDEVEGVPAQRGRNVRLTLDLELQRACEEALDGQGRPGAGGLAASWPGSIVLLDPRTGQVLALATSPRPSRDELAERYAELLAAPGGPLFERSLGAGISRNLPPPGSTFKPLAALAALQAGVLLPGDRLNCSGRLTVGNQSLGCLGTHGEISLRDALARSCNLYFYRVADRVGGDPLLEVAKRFGYGRPTHLLEGNEQLLARGLPPGPGLREWWVALESGPLARSEAMRLAIGQAPLDDVTPLQVAVAFAALGTGWICPPSLIGEVEGAGPLPPRTPVALGYERTHLEAVREGLEAVVDSPNGTAFELHDLLRGSAARDLARQVAGKTGTPEVASKPDHSWFAGYLPREAPTLAFAVFLEHTGEHGGTACVPVLARLLKSPAVQAWLSEGRTP